MAKSTAPKRPENSTDSIAAQTGVWPGAFGIFKSSRDVVRRNLSTFFALVLFAVIINMVLALFFPNEGDTNNATANLAGYLLSVWPSTAIVIAVLASLRDEAISATDALQEAVRFYLRTLALGILTLLITIISVLALVIPVFFVYPRIMLAPYFLVDRDLGPIEALKASWEETRGYSTKVWGVVAVNVLFGVLMFVLVGIYLVFMYLAAEGLLYAYITSRKAAGKSSAAPITPQASKS